MRTLAETTQEVLGLAAKHFRLPAGSLAPEDDFFKKLGIDSLQALELLSRLENHFGIELPDYEGQGGSDFRTLTSPPPSPPQSLFGIDPPDYELRGVSDFRPLAPRIQPRL